jgi:hypothetical protein
MYQFSRSLYRELAPYISEDRMCSHGGGDSNHARVLRACEGAVERMASDRRYFARPARTLFNDVRVYFPMAAQRRVYRVVECHMNVARQFFAQQALHGLDIEGNPLSCRATTRKGKPCQRIPLPHNGYCPSHQHLAETEDLELVAA